MDIAQIYGKLKKAGTIKLRRHGTEGSFSAEIRQFDPMTGEEIAPAVGNFERRQIEAEIVRIEAMADSMREILSDLDALNTTPPRSA